MIIVATRQYDVTHWFLNYFIWNISIRQNKTKNNLNVVDVLSHVPDIFLHFKGLIGLPLLPTSVTEGWTVDKLQQGDLFQHL